MHPPLQCVEAENLEKEMYEKEADKWVLFGVEGCRGGMVEWLDRLLMEWLSGC